MEITQLAGSLCVRGSLGLAGTAHKQNRANQKRLKPKKVKYLKQVVKIRHYSKIIIEDVKNASQPLCCNKNGSLKSTVRKMR